MSHPFAYAGILSSLFVSGMYVLGDGDRRSRVYYLTWDSFSKRAMTVSIFAVACALIVWGDARTKLAAEKGLIAFLIALLAEAHMTFAPFWIIMAVSFIIAS